MLNLIYQGNTTVKNPVTGILNHYKSLKKDDHQLTPKPRTKNLNCPSGLRPWWWSIVNCQCQINWNVYVNRIQIFAHLNKYSVRLIDRQQARQCIHPNNIHKKWFICTLPRTRERNLVNIKTTTLPSLYTRLQS